MLKKELCKKCWNNIPDIGWTKYDDEWWDEWEVVLCPTIYLEEGESEMREITDKPPNKCPCYLGNIL